MVDVSRFDVLRRSALRIVLGGGRGFTAQLRTTRGGFVDATREDGTIERDIARGSVSFLPTTTGRWRARAAYTGTRTAAPSTTGTATGTVEGPPQGR